MTVHLFTDQWYSDFIHQTAQAFPVKASPDARTLGVAVMTAGAFIAQAIDNSFGPAVELHSKNSMAGALYELAHAVHQIADKDANL